MQMPAGAAKKAPCSASLTEQDEIAEVIDWLREIDWSQTGTDLAVVGIPQPDGSISITAKDGKVTDFNFYWDGKFIDVKANRLIRGGDMTKLQNIVERLCK